MDRYQAIASGQDEAFEEEESGDPYQRLADGRGYPSEQEKSGHKIGKVGVVVLLAVATILDILSVADILVADFPVADIISTIFSFLLAGYLLWKGIPSVRPMLQWLATYLAEWIPIVDWLPLYIIGIILVIASDRSALVAATIKYVPSKNMATKKAASGAASCDRTCP